MQELSLYTDKVKPWCNIRVDDLIVDGAFNYAGTISGQPTPTMEVRDVTTSGFWTGTIPNVIFSRQGGALSITFPEVFIPLIEQSFLQPLIIDWDDQGSDIPPEFLPRGGYASRNVQCVAALVPLGVPANTIGSMEITPAMNKIVIRSDIDPTSTWQASIGNVYALTNRVSFAYPI